MTHARLGLALVSAACCVLTTAVHAQYLLTYDGFATGPQPDLDGSAGGTGWITPWSLAGSDPTAIVAEGLEYPGLLTAAGAALTPFVEGNAANSIYERDYGPLPVTNSIFVSFLLREDAGVGEWGGLTFAGTTTLMRVGVPEGTHMIGLGIDGGDVDLTGVPVVQGETNLVVVRISRLVMPAVVTYRLYVNPMVGEPQPGFYDAQIWVEGSSVLPASLAISNSTGFTTDEIRIGLTWESVLPAQSTLGDLDGDGIVGAADLALLLGYWGQPEGDLDGDGVTGSSDLAVLLGAWDETR